MSRTTLDDLKFITTWSQQGYLPCLVRSLMQKPNMKVPLNFSMKFVFKVQEKWHAHTETHRETPMINR